MRNIHELARRIVPGDEVCDQPLSEAEWSVLEALVRHERLAGYRRDAILEGRMSASDDQAIAAEARLVASMERSVAIEAMVGRIADLLRADSVEVVALKGLAACRLVRRRT